MTPKLLTSAAYWRGVVLKQRARRAALRVRIRRIELAIVEQFDQVEMMLRTRLNG